MGKFFDLFFDSVYIGSVGLPGFEPGTFGPPDQRANQAAPQPVKETLARKDTKVVESSAKLGKRLIL